MVPTPIAVLTLFYGLVATLAAARVWRVMSGASHQSLPWAVGWLALSAGAACGLPLLKPWGRTLAVITSAALMAATLAAAAALIASGHPAAGLTVTFTTAFHALVIRYLGRPAVKRHFVEG
ncbi:MAG: hypothetical protein HYT90_01915 [Candidatus Omnitrophica bacterium]|nr:hypothetical protein [Candidatus Omnitrophota bacterium]